MVTADTTRTAATIRFARGASAPPVDTTPTPTNLIASGDIAGVALSWSFLNPPAVISHFDVKRAGVKIGEATTTSYVDTTATSGVTYQYTVEYAGVASNAASGIWSSTPTTDIEVLSVTHATTGATIAINAVTGASLYQFERSTDPLIGFTEIREQAGTSYQDTSGTAGVAYFYRARHDDSSPSAARIGVKRATAGADAATLGTLDLTANITDAFIKLPITGDANHSATAYAEYRAGSGSWHHCPTSLWRSLNSNTFYGILPLLTPGTTYTVRVTVADPDGVSGSNFAEASVTTKTGTVSDPTTLTATQTFATMTAAIAAANTASSDQVIRVSAGYVQRSATAFSGAGGHSVTLVAENMATTTPAGGFNAPRNDATAHTVVYERFTAPTSSNLDGDDVNTGVGILGKGIWSAEPGLGSGIYSANIGTTVRAIQVHYTDASGGAGYATYKAAEPLRLGVWKLTSTGDLSTAAGWASQVLTNRSYTAGAWQASGSSTLYVRLPGSLNPNSCYVWIGTGTETSGTPGVTLNGPNLRLSGFNFRALPVGVRLGKSAVDFVIDRNHTRGCGSGIRTLQASGGAAAHDGIIQYNRFSDSNMWSRAQTGIAWRWIKQNYRTAADADYTGTNRVGADSCETKSVLLDRAGRLIAIRWCDTDGIFNGVNNYLGNTDPEQGYGISVYECTWRNVADDCVEPEGFAINWSVTRPDVEDVRVFVSTDFAGGPLYLTGARAFHVSSIGVIPDGRVNTSDPNSTTGGGAFFKTGGDAVIGGAANPALIAVFNSTLWNDETHPNTSPSRAFNDAVGGAGSESYYIRNTIIRNVSDISNLGGSMVINEDYNAMATESGDLQVPGGSFTTITDWRNSTPYGDHTNKVGAAGADVDFLNTTAIDALFTDAPNGDLTLAVSSQGKNKGRPLGSINESDSAPDLGYEGAS